MFRRNLIVTTGGSDIEHNKYVSQVSTIMKALRNEYGDLLSQFDKIDASEAKIIIKSLKHLVDNHDIAANKGRIIGQLPIRTIFWILENFYKKH